MEDLIDIIVLYIVKNYYSTWTEDPNPVNFYEVLHVENYCCEFNFYKVLQLFKIRKCLQVWQLNFSCSLIFVEVFNLNLNFHYKAGHDAGSAGMYNHTLVFNAAKMTPVDAKTLIPTGEIKEVKDTPFDLTATGKLGEKIKSLPDEINGFDHNFCVNQTGAKVDHDLFKVCQFEHEDSGRRLECFTNQPGVQFYTGEWF